MKKYLPWIIWTVTTLLIIFYLAQQLESEEKQLFLPGQTSSGHYQIEQQCNACHGESFSDMKTMQKNCVACHGKELKAVKDSHPKRKFTDPRNANRIEVLDARYCVSCHVEHKPEITHEMGVTQAKGLCIKCHQDVAEDRPSHQGMAFETCASAGCHNYHDNRALYEDFLLKHASEPDHKANSRMPKNHAHQYYFKNNPGIKALTTADIDAPLRVNIDNRISHDWSISSHAEAGVNCSGCHNDDRTAPWIDKPELEQCLSCHKPQSQGFLEGKHGMRLKAGLEAMQTNMARLAMNPNKTDKALGCISCHGDHEFNAKKAAVEACIGCHMDEHSSNYKQSPHYQSWLKTLSGQLDSNQGVSCATCHMPTMEQTAAYQISHATQHNQNFNLRPNEKMIRSVCMNCHGLKFSIDALADKVLIKSNFNAQPTIHIKSIDMATARDK